MYNFANLSHLPTAKQTNKTFFVNSNHLLTFQPNDTLFHALIFFLSLSLNRDGKLFVLLLLPNFLSLFSLFTRVFLLYQKMPELKIERDVVRICVYVFPLRPFFFPRPTALWFTSWLAFKHSDGRDDEPKRSSKKSDAAERNRKKNRCTCGNRTENHTRTSTFGFQSSQAKLVALLNS